MEISGSAYMFIFPKAFYPDYQKHCTVNNKEIYNQYPYQFHLEILIKSNRMITYVSKPLNCDSMSPRKVGAGNQIRLHLSKPSELIRLYYRITDMHKPELLWAKNPGFPNEVAWSMSFAATFETRSKSAVKREIVENKEPISTLLHYSN